MKPIASNDRGYTVTEQLLVSLFALIVVGTLYGFYREQLFNLVSQETKTATLEDARGALEIMIRDLRNAGSWGSDGAAPPETAASIDDPNEDSDSVCNRVYAATGKLLMVQMDLNGNGNCSDTELAVPPYPSARETIKYELTGPTRTCPGLYIVRRNGDCLVANVTTPAPEKLFTYYDSEGNDLGDNPARDDIKRVKITLSVEVKNPNPKVGGTVTSTLSSSLEFRN